MFRSHLFWSYKLLCCSCTMKLKETWFEDFYSFEPRCIYLLAITQIQAQFIKIWSLCYLYKSIRLLYKSHPSTLCFCLKVFFVVVSSYSLVIFLLLLNEWGKTCKNSICKFWVAGPQGAYLCLKFLDQEIKMLHEVAVSRPCEKASFFLALN